MKHFFPESLGQKHGYALYTAKYGSKHVIVLLFLDVENPYYNLFYLFKFLK